MTLGKKDPPCLQPNSRSSEAPSDQKTTSTHCVKAFHLPKLPPTFAFAWQCPVVEEGGVLPALSQGAVPLLPNYNWRIVCV